MDGVLETEATAMTRPRFSIGGLMALVILAALGVTAVRFASPGWVSIVLTLDGVLLGVALLRLILRRGTARAFGAGFLILGGGYALLVFGPQAPNENIPRPVTTPAFEWLANRRAVGTVSQATVTFRGTGSALSVGQAPTLYATTIQATGSSGAAPVPVLLTVSSVDSGSLAFIGHGLCLALLGTIGGLYAARLRRKRDEELDRPGRPRPWPVVVAVLGIAVLAAVALRAASPVWADGLFSLALLTVGIAAIAAINGSGRPRAAAAGISTFGLAYTLLLLNPTWLPSARLPASILAETIHAEAVGSPQASWVVYGNNGNANGTWGVRLVTNLSGQSANVWGPNGAVWSTPARQTPSPTWLRVASTLPALNNLAILTRISHGVALALAATCGGILALRQARRGLDHDGPNSTPRAGPIGESAP